MAACKRHRIITISLLILFISVLLVLPSQQARAAPIDGLATRTPLSQPYDTTGTPTTSFKMIAILVEFSDLKHKVAVDVIKRRLSPTLNDYLQEVSYGKASVTIDVAPDWILVPKNFSSYGTLLGWFPGALAKQRTELLTDIVQAAAKQVNVGQYDGLIIIIPSTPFTAFSSFSPTSAGGSVINWTTVQTENTPADTFAHEFGHSPFGMPDLYDKNLNDLGEYSGIYVGPWCLMSYNTSFIHFFTFNKILAGWIPPERIKNISPSTSAFVTLEPTATKTDGIQVIKIPVDNKKYYLLENRQKIGFDKSIPDEGVLVTFVDETGVTKPEKIIQGPPGFVRIKDAEPSTEKLSDATFAMMPDKKNVFTDESQDLAVIVFPTEGKACDVYVTTSSAYKQISNVVDLITQAKGKIDEAKTANFGAPEALALTKEAEAKLIAAIKSLKANNHKAVEQDAANATKLIEKTSLAEQRYIEAKSVFTRADNAIKKAESEGRIKGLDESRKLLQQFQSILDTYDYDKAIIAAVKAKKIAEAAAK